VSVNIKAQFAAKERPRNGLENIAKQLVDDPLTPVWIVARAFCPRTSVNNLEGGAITPVVQLDLIEPMLTTADEAKAKALLDRNYKARNGHLPPETLLGEPEPADDDELEQDPLPLDGDDEGDGPI
jgi:hypothetical protein